MITKNIHPIRIDKTILDIYKAVKNRPFDFFTHRFIERVDYDWHFEVIEFDGNVAQPTPYNIVEEGICNLLLIKDLEFYKIFNMLGFEFENNFDEGMFRESVFTLLDEMVQTEENGNFSLTHQGRYYAEKECKFEKRACSFEIVVDTFGNYARPLLQAFKNRKLFSKKPTSLVLDREKVENWAMDQAPEVHSPETGYYLLKYELLKATQYTTCFEICAFENFETQNTELWVFDKHAKRFSDELTHSLRVQTELCDNLISEIKRKIITFLPINTQKSDNQIQFERDTIGRKKNRVMEATIRHLDEIQFELELEEVFSTARKEIILLSPFANNHAMQVRKNQIEMALKNNCNVFIGYSKDYTNQTITNVDEKTLLELHQLAQKYKHFYFMEMPQFHEKMLLVDFGHRQQHYIGSFNILSFHAVPQHARTIARETMVAHAWTAQSVQRRQELLQQFEIPIIDKIVAKSQKMKFFYEKTKSFNENITQNEQKINEIIPSWLSKEAKLILEMKKKEISKEIMLFWGRVIEDHFTKRRLLDKNHPDINTDLRSAIEICKRYEWSDLAKRMTKFLK